jgi:Zn-dependent protease
LKCQYCGTNVDLPFKCQFCGGYYCVDHRLPENHECPEIWQTKARGAPPTETHLPQYVEKKPGETITRFPSEFIFRPKKAGWTSSTELIHLFVGALIIMAIGFSWGGPQLEWVYRIFSDPVGTFAWGMFFTAIFISHELAHKATARHYGLWAEFRISVLGAALTILSIMSPIKIISPGAVIIAGIANKKIVGITALAGPLMSTVVAYVLFGIYFLVPGSTNALSVLQGAFLSVWIAVFNLIPMAVLDGAKIFSWNKLAWAASFGGAIVLMIAMLFF